MAKKLTMVRSAMDEYKAVEVADAMESAGGDVFAIIMSPIIAPKALVYCKIPDATYYEKIDQAIEATW